MESLKPHTNANATETVDDA
ncbi:hypothetical protein CCACVL1_15351 [Corchorus capsularis]|uniref:Uncharacterized protein n=1 Tax=Corchorus capsularis TaxID=210143 RepID=A0A1R3I2T5_COCAP|nr:hypothetical protein CCACVL1_15351 [Corchorus capsularis]